MSTAAVALRGVTKRFGASTAVDGVSFDVPDVGVYGLIGPNGAGKTTLFRMISGFLAPDEGRIEVRGQTVMPGEPMVGLLSAMPQDAQLRPRRVVDELRFLARVQGAPRGAAEEALARVGVSELAARPIHRLSHGQRKRVAVAQALMGPPSEVIALDEPTAGVDPKSAIELRACLAELGRHRCVLLSSHDLHEVESLCARAAILDRGRLVAEGLMSELVGSGARLQASLTGSAISMRALESGLRSQPGVRQVRLEDGELTIDMSEGAAVDEVNDAFVREVVELGLSLRALRRGRGLSSTFLEATRDEPRR